ncbi:NADH dehydrogenase [ubiquinone] 1 alpha subcomplex assembly factor 2 isoform X1 [Conger conger]|uniref:NADH dehydrogenase [ubiquinone] 1 alpha subcomplex assembly factor 2 isoform X1 n=1 Tax=Conger conger TaxID=82655 RepID=UPI002A5A877F|nr:NADH dehydrogenase [ubiquinone] 1 alpha subcomplex assembly factor 2 isoform X1 [Conger conger]
MSRIAALFRSFRIVKEHVGTDHFGNKYFFIPEQKTWTGRSVRQRRMIEAANPKEFEYLEGNIPCEWDAWIRGRRKTPPTVEELLQNERYRAEVKLRVEEAEQRDLALQRQEYEDGLVARPAQTLIKGHASATHYGQVQEGEEPVSTANTFQPGAWTPGGNTPKK